MSKHIVGVYKITHRETGRCYVGSSINIFKRWDAHRYPAHNNCHYLAAAMKKYSPEAFDFQILEEIDTSKLTLIQTRVELLTTEQRWLDKLRPFPPNGFNIRRYADSNLGIKRSLEAIQKTRIANTGRKFSQEVRKKVSLACIGRHHSPETRQKLSEARRGKPISLALRQKLSAIAIGRRHSPEAIQRMRVAQSGKILSLEHRQKIGNANRGRIPSLETRRKMSLAHKKLGGTNGNV